MTDSTVNDAPVGAPTEDTTPQAISTVPSLTGVVETVTYLENTVNATPQVLDANVTFTDPDSDYNGGTLTVSGLLAEDIVGIANDGVVSAGGGVILYTSDIEPVQIGTYTGGVGGTFTITFNAFATSAAVDAVIQHLAYSNTSDTPTASRTLTINVTDAGGHSLITPAGAASFTAAGVNPFAGMGLGGTPAPTFVDYDGDGDLDMVAGNNAGTFNVSIHNGASWAAPVSAFAGAGIGSFSSPTTIDFDKDGDMDVVAGNGAGQLVLFRNNGGGLWAAATVVATGLGAFTLPTAIDVDGDGDADLIVGTTGGTIAYLRHDADSTFTRVTGAGNPFNGVSISDGSPAAIDLDGDGDKDLIFGDTNGGLRSYTNNGNGTFTFRSSTVTPSAAAAHYSMPGTADIDGDGDLDLIVGTQAGAVTYWINGSVLPTSGSTIVVNVTPEEDAPAISGVPTDVSATEDVSSSVDLSATSLTFGGASLSIILTASAGTLTATTGGGVTVTGSGTGALTLTGTAAAIDTFLNTASNIAYLGAANVNGDNAATITFAYNIGGGAVTISTVNVDITGVIDSPTLTGFAETATFLENTVNATPQLLDANVTFTAPDSAFATGHLTVSGLLTEDRVSVQNTGTAAGQIGFNSGTGVITYGGVIIGTATGGSGATFSVAFTAAATATAVDALIQALTYADVSDTPTASRVLTLNVIDAAGNDLNGPTATIGGGSGHAAPVPVVHGQQITVNVTAQNDTPVLTGVVGSVILGSTQVSILDNDVTLTDPEGNFNGGTLVVTGLLAEDKVGVRNEGATAGLVGVSGSTVKYGGVTIGTIAGGVGGTLTITFNGSATSAAVDAVIQNLTYASTAGYNPTAARTLNLTVTDAAAASTATASLVVNVLGGYVAGPGNDTLGGTNGNDTLWGLGGDDVLNGLGGNDTINGGDGKDIITGSTGDDTLNGDAGDDTLDGGAGTDVLNGGDGADRMDGGTGDDQLFGGLGADKLYGGAGKDTLDGGAGADLMAGGAGDDTYYVNDAGDTIQERPGEGTDTAYVSVNNWVMPDDLDIMYLVDGAVNGTGSAGANTIYGGAAINVLNGGGGNDSLYGYAGADTLNGDDGNDFLYGGTENDTLNGGQGADTLNGEDGNDTLRGGTEADTLNGGAGNDILIGGEQGDTHTGGSGADQFIFDNTAIRRFALGLGVQKDVITDFSVADGDHIDLSAIDANVNLAGDQAFTFVTKFTNVAGQALLKFNATTHTTALQLDVDGDGKVDHEITINGDVTSGVPILANSAVEGGGWIL